MGEKGQKRKKSVSSPKPKSWMIVSITLLIICGVLFGTYYMVTHKANSSYLSFLNSVKLNVDKTNSENAKLFAQVEGLNHKNSKEVEALMSSIQKNIEAIDKGLKDLDAYNPIPKYSEQFNAFRNGVKANKNIYTQALTIIRNPEHKDIMNSVTNLEALVSETSNNYEKSKLGKVHITLPNEILNLPGSIRGYAMTAFNDFEARTKLQEQYIKYFDSMEKVVADFQSAKTPLHNSIDSMGAGKTTIGDIYIDIDKKLNVMSSIKSSYDEVSIPAKLAAKHKKMDKLIKDYFLYCQDLKSLLTKLEEAGNSEAVLNALGDQLGQVEVKYEEITSSFLEYFNEFKNDKYFYQDVNNL